MVTVIRLIRRKYLFATVRLHTMAEVQTGQEGVFPPPSFESDPEKLMLDYRRRIDECTVEKVIAEALADTATVKFQAQMRPAETREHFLSTKSLLVKIKLGEIL
jgi:hypothetical protein